MAEADRASALSVTGLAVSIRGVDVLTDVNLSLPRGGALGVVGETGSGKTITTRALTGTLWRVGGTVTGGRVELAGHDLTSAPERVWQKMRGRRVALVPQSSQSGLDPLMTVRQQMRETLNVLSPGSEADARAHELLTSVGLTPTPELLRAHPHQLSGGMRQRVMIALALAGDAELLIGDEPTTALDVTVQRGILETLARLRHERQLSLVLISHDLGVVEEVTDTVAIMYAGITVESGPTAQVLSDPAHPYTEALLQARPAIDGDRVTLRPVPGAPSSASAVPPGCPFAERCPYATAICRETPPVLLPRRTGHLTACLKRQDPSLSGMAQDAGQ